jgi:hypothetical protein
MIVRILLGLFATVAICFGQLPDSVSNTKVKNPESTNDSGNTIELAAMLPAQLTGKDPDFKSIPGIFFALDIGQAMRGVYNHVIGDLAGENIPPYTTMSRVWQQKMLMYLSETLIYKERLSLTISVECDLDFSMLVRKEAEYEKTTAPLFSFYPNDIALRYKWGDLNKPLVQIAVGYFPYKYNVDAKNLGEFLLRSSAYPNTIVSKFEFAKTRELGLIVSTSTEPFLDPSIDKFSFDFLLTSETHDWPVQDGTISVVASNTLLNFFTLGGGMSLQRIFPVNEEFESPENDKNVYYSANGDTNYYSFQATKAVGFASINPQRFIPEFKIPPAMIFGKNPFFGKQDFKMYAELGVLGLDNYVNYDSIQDTITKTKYWQPIPDSLNYYNKIGDRMPVMFGVNLPTHPFLSYGILPFLLTKWLYDETGSDIRPLAWVTLIPALTSGLAQEFLGWDLSLDEFSLEFEWFSQRYTNNNRNPINFQEYNIPIPVTTVDRDKSNFGKSEPTKYSLYFKKSFLNKRFAISGQVARDHMRPIIFGDPSNIQTDDFLQSKDHWWWAIRVSANF